MQLLLLVVFLTAVYDLVYTIYRGASKSEPVAMFQYLSPIVLAVSMVRKKITLSNNTLSNLVDMRVCVSSTVGM